jgi:hypothetical protein
VLGTWPVYSLAFITALLNIKIPFMSTPKTPGKASIKIITMQILMITGLTAGIIYKWVNYVDYLSLITMIFAIVLILLHSGIFYATWESHKRHMSVQKPKQLDKLKLPTEDYMMRGRQF